MQYWVNVFTPSTLTAAQGDGRRGGWFSTKTRSQRVVRESAVGDRIFFYVAKVGFVGLWEVTGPAEIVTDGPFGDAFDVHVPAVPLVELSLHEALPLSRIPVHAATHHDGRFGVWHVQQSGACWGRDGAGEHVEQVLRAWAAQPERQELTTRQLDYSPPTGQAANLPVNRSDARWIAVVREVIGSETRVAAAELVRRAAAQGLRGTGGLFDADALLTAVADSDGREFYVDDRQVVRTTTAVLPEPAPHEDDPLGLLAATSAIRDHRMAVKQALLGEMGTMDPHEFEKVVGRLLEALGVEDAAVTRKSRDGGIDVSGTLRAAEVITRPIVVEVKRYQGNIGVEKVRALGGVVAQQPGRVGLFVTLSEFTAGARTEAARMGLSLMNGDELTSAMLKHEIGVRRSGAALWEYLGFH